ncbi:MAG: hypothetical protein HYZ57_09970 [Acidobacteria bacterium]|nr:hypothetical protein [Acidobacteriota bacterium]MBI3280154.1 hypothetical protein [Acidobacteriota bacterium]
MKRFAVIASAVLSAAPSLPGQRVMYTKSFPGSVPAYVGIELSSDGSAVYKEAPDDEQPVKFQIPREAAGEIFALARKLDRFKRPLEANLKVANMGIKTLRWEDGAEKNEVKFNYSLDLDAKALTDWFERLTETQLHLFALERAVRFDKLGVHKAILQVEAAYDRQRLVGLERFLPMLDRVAKNESYLHMARERAAALAAAFRNPRPPAPPQ